MPTILDEITQGKKGRKRRRAGSRQQREAISLSYCIRCNFFP